MARAIGSRFLLLLLALAGSTNAKDAILGTYDVKGTHSQKGAFTGQVRVESTDEAIHVVLHTTYPNGGSDLLRGRVWKDSETNPLHREDGERIGDEVRLKASSFVGGTGAVEGAVAATGVLTFRVLDGGPKCTLQASLGGAELEAEGKRQGEWKDLAGHLLVYSPEGLKAEVKQLLGKELLKALKEGVDIRQRLKLSDYLHVGIGGEVAWLPPEELTDVQLATLAANEDKVWLSSEIEGGIRLPFGVSIPLGSAASISLGFQPGVELHYTVVDLYQRPAGIKDVKTIAADLKAMGKRVVDLPLTAPEAEALVPGAERELEGIFTVAVSGGLGIGHDTSELNDILEIGASARVGGFYRLRRDLRMGVTRLAGRAVRLRVENGRGSGVGAEARVFLGASINEDAVVEEVNPSAEYLEPVIELAANGVDSVVKDVLRFELTGAFGKDRSQGMDLAWKLDLSVPAARLAYDRAVRGDLTVLDRLADQPGSGVELEFRVLDVERHAYARGELRVSLLAEGHLSRDVTEKVLSVQDGDKLTRYEIFRFSRKRALGLMKLIKSLQQKWDESLYVEVIRATPGNASAAAALNLPQWVPQKRSLTFRYDIKDPFTRKSEMARLRRTVAAWGLLDVSAIPTPGKKLFQTRWGKTETRLLVEVAEVGMWVLDKQTPEQLEAAYLAAHAAVHDEAPDSSKAKKRAKAFAANVRGLSEAQDSSGRAAHLRELCEDAGWDLTMITAVRSLVPESALHVQVAMDGKRIDFDGELKGRKFSTVVPVVPGQ